MALIERFTPGGNLYPDGSSTFATLVSALRRMAENRDNKDSALQGAWRQDDRDTIAAAQTLVTTQVSASESRSKAHTNTEVAEVRANSFAYTDASFAAAGPGGAADDQVDAAVERAVLAERVASPAMLPEGGVRAVGKGELEINVKDHGVKGDGATNDSPAIQALIDANVGKGANLYFPPGDYRLGVPLILKSGVYLTGHRVGYSYLPGSSKSWTTRFAPLGALPSLVTGPSTGVGQAGVQGIDFEGWGNASRGIDLPRATWCQFRDIHMNNFLDQFIYIGEGQADTIDNFLGVNGLRRPVAERTVRVGSIELGGTDHYLMNIETGGGYTPGAMTADGLNTGIYITGGSIFGYAIVSEFSETGYYFASSAVGNRFTMCRADKGGGHGFVIAGSHNAFSTCHSANMAREANATYSGFRTTGSGVNSNVFSACRVHYISSYTPNRPKYAFEDNQIGGDAGNRNAWTACTGQYTDRMFYGDDYEGVAPVIPPNVRRHPASATTLDVTNSGVALLSGQSSPTTITSMSGAAPGQTVRVVADNNNVTIAHNRNVSVRGSISTSTGAAKPLTQWRAYVFTNVSGVWVEDA